MDTEPIADNTTKPKQLFLFNKSLLIAACVVLISAVFGYSKTTTPNTFILNTVLEVESGMSVQQIAKRAHEQGLVKSQVVLYSVLTYFYDPTNIYAGRYVFEEPTNVFGVANILASKDIEEDLVRLTFPEGITLKAMADIAAAALPQFNTDDYLLASTTKEGYLFPDTYLVPETFTAHDLSMLQNETFATKVATLNRNTAYSSLTIDEAVILASIIEREANDEESMKIVSGILQNRLSIGMALQADATIEYVLDTPLHELPPGKLAHDLRELDSPYNTYLYTGLPPTAIGNPGLQALHAAFNPTPSDYFYYITGVDGKFYYAKTLAEHNQNIERYLR